MFLIIIIAICLAIATWAYKSKFFHSTGKCFSSEDMQFQIPYETQRIISSVESNKIAIVNALHAANSSISIAWLSSYEKIIKASTNLEANLNYCTLKKLEHAKFQYYTSLWYRSMINANTSYKQFKNIETSYHALNNLIVEMKNGRNVGMPRNQVYVAKDCLKELTKLHLDHLRNLNYKTGLLRDKVGSECGERGKRWWNERMRNKS